MPQSHTLVGGTATKQIPLNELQRFFPTLFPGADEHTALSLYRLVSWTYRCIQIRADAVMQMPWTLRRRGDEDSEVDMASTLYADVDWRWLWWRTIAARDIWGVAYWLKRKDGELQWLNPSTMSLIADNAQGITAFEQRVGNVHRRWRPDQIVYLPMWSPTADLGPGVAPGHVAQPPGALVANANEFTSKFFERGALPWIVLSSDRDIRKEDQDRVETTWDRIFGGLSNMFKTVVLGKGLKPTVVSFPLKDLALPELLEKEKEQLSTTFGIPLSLLDTKAGNFATARQDDKNLYTKTIIPMSMLNEASVNKQLWWPLTYEWEWRFADIEAIQQDEAEKAEGVAELMEEADRQFAAGVLTRDRAVWLAEELWESLGYTFPDDKPDEEPEEEEEPELEQVPGQVPPEVVQQQQALQQAATRSMESTAMRDALRRWRRKCKNRGRITSFRSFAIPEWVKTAVITRFIANSDTAFDPFLKATIGLHGEIERKLIRRLEGIYRSWSERITDAAIAGRTIDLAPMYTEIQSATAIMYQNAVEGGVLGNAAELGWNGVDYGDLLADSIDAIGADMDTLVGRISATDQKYIASVQSRIAEGKLTEDAARELLGKFFSGPRASVIGITETTRALQLGSDLLQANLRAQGRETTQRWHTAQDDRVDEECEVLDGTTEEFWRSRAPDGPPIHPGGRCVTTVERV